MAPRACAVAAFVRPRFGTALAEWDLAIIDPLLVARLDAESLLGSAGRLVVAPYAIGKRPDPPLSNGGPGLATHALWLAGVVAN